MKRLACMAFVLLLAAGLCCKKEQKVEREGIVNFITGTVSIIDGGNKAPAKVGDTVKKGMKIETGDKSSIDIYFDENAIKIMENSLVEITDLVIDTQDESEKTRVRITNGKVFSKVAKKLAKNDQFEISTPTTTAGVRGTEFLVAEDKGKGLVACLNGTVVVKNEASPEKGTVDVTDNKEVIVEKDKEMVVKDLSAENRRLMEDISKNFQDMKKDIRERFEKKREEIRKAVQDQRQKNKESVERQKAIDKENVENQKARDKENVDRLKAISDKTGSEAKEGVSRQQEESRSKIEGMKPQIKKFKGSVDK